MTSLTTHFSKPRISGLFRDLNPGTGGTISWRQLADRAAVTYQNVPAYGTTNSNNFQIEMFFDGKIRITVLSIASTDGLIGLSQGLGLPADFVTSNFTAYPPVPPPPPVVTSVLTATGTAGYGFNYQITATNSPTDYKTFALPSGLTVAALTGVISGTATQSGTFTPTISASNAGGTGNAILNLILKPSFTSWQSGRFSSAQLSNAAISGATATPAGDGITNLMKYALNLDPLTSGDASLPVAGTTTVSGTKYLTITYTQVIAATDIVYTVEVSADLQTWNSGSGFTAQVSVTNNPDGVTQTVVVQDLTPLGNAERRFIRLKVATKP